ncbi:MAG: NAD(P)-dependent oxidoreductase [Sphingobacteriaceae bacterium]|nr:NAD(P)-dependent oxidoreductase [Sphingobacteriaceae bacterium]
MNKQNVGWIGLGKMGLLMAQNLINAGYLLKVYNRTKGKADLWLDKGVKELQSPAELLKESDVVILMVSDDSAIHEIFTSENGLLSSPEKGKIIINMSTVSPAISKEMAHLSKNNGNSYIDAPVSGSVKQATEGSLVIMAGGDHQTFEEVKPIFNVLGKLALKVGENGAGNAAKLAINTMLGLHAQGLAETILFANQQGISTKDLMELINNSALGNAFIKIKGEAILNDKYEAAFALKHIAKDLRLAKNEGLDSPLANVLNHSFQVAEQDLAEEDIIAIIKKIV